MIRPETFIRRQEWRISNFVPLTIGGSTAVVFITRGFYALIDVRDWPMIARHKWTAQPQDRTVYAYRRCLIGGQSTRVNMHSLIAGFSRPDHKNRNGLDNRRTNLRRSTQHDNARNQRPKGGASKFHGVGLSPPRVRSTKPFMARIRTSRKRLFLGYFRTEVEAAMAYDAAAKIHHGEFASLNFSPQQKEGSVC